MLLAGAPMVSDGRDTDEQVAGMGAAEVRKSLPLRGSRCVCSVEEVAAMVATMGQCRYASAAPLEPKS